MGKSKYNLTKEILIPFLKEGRTQKEIAEILGCSKSTVSKYIIDLELQDLQKNKKLPLYAIDKIDTPFKAYLLGFVSCDASVKNNMVELSIALADKEILDFIASNVNAKVTIDKTFDPKIKRFPRARMIKKIKDINTYLGGEKKVNRNFPIVSDKLVKYELLGAFDADGSLSWGYRKDKNRLWQKISFTTSYNIAVAIQKILIKELKIPTVVRQKQNDNCYVIEFASKKDVISFLDYIYSDKNFIVLQRKFNKYRALRLELEENGGTWNDQQYRAEPTEQEGVETSGENAIFLNNHISLQG